MTTTSFEPKRIVWDIEGDGLLNTVTTIWCVAIRDIDDPDSAELFSDYDPSLRSVNDAIDVMNAADMWVNHNIIGFDIEVLKKLGYKLKLPPVVIDTLLCSQVLYPAPQNFKFPHRVPAALSWSHSLKAWGHRLGEAKGEYSDWSKYTPEMGAYCLQDTATNLAVAKFLKARAEAIEVPWEFNELPSPLAIEHQFKSLIMRQQATGFCFNRAAAEGLSHPLLAEHEAILTELQEVFPPITKTVTYTTKVRKEVKTKTTTIPFNPGSRQQVAERLIALGWEPPELTKSGRQPKIDETTMAHAASVVPQAKLIDRYYTLQKYLGMLIQGDNAWLRLERNGRIHGEVNTLGAITTRCTHNKPNLSQTPRVGSWLGEECRGLFHARPGWALVGADLAGIELRCLAHYMSRWDADYADHVLNGDVHTVHQQAFGLPPGKEWRSIGKSGTYCLNKWGRCIVRYIDNCVKSGDTLIGQS